MHTATDKENSSDFRHIFKYHIFPQASAGVIDRMIFHPWETINTLKQDSGLAYRPLIQSFWEERGWRGFYQAYWSNVAAAIPIRVSIFGTYSFAKEQGEMRQYSAWATGLAAGILTGFLETSILCPVEAYRVRKTLSDTAHLPFQLRYVFKGYSSLLARTCLENTVCLLGTDLLLSLCQDPDASMRFVSALISGSLSQYIATPFDTIKTRRMKYPDTRYSEVIFSLYQENGLHSFFRSAHAKAARTGVCNAMMIGGSRLIVEQLDRNKTCPTFN